MLLALMMSLGLTAAPAARVCPVQPEPAALASAAFKIRPAGETVLFSAAPSFQSVRYAVRIVRPTKARRATGTLVRLQRRSECNVHDRAGQWAFKLSAGETEEVFRAAAALERLGPNPSDIALDGTNVELQRYASGKRGFAYSSNGLAKERLSNVMFAVLKRHVPASELPRAADWRYKPPGSAI